MIGFPDMLVSAAKKAGMKVPNNPNKFVDEAKEYPHFFVFCAMQLGKPVRFHGEHWRNAEVISNLSNEEIIKVGLEDLINKGFIY